MGWSDEAFRDSEDVLGAGKDSMWISGSLTRDQFNALIVFAGTNVGSRDSRHPLRSVDILPTVLRAMGIRPGPGLDGKAVELPRRR